MTGAVVDTNVGITANKMASHASPDCVLNCINKLERIVNGKEKLVIDDRGEILAEYMDHLHMSGQPGVGDLFMRWLHENQFHETKCERVTITPTNKPWPGYAEFPNDPALKRFDRSDRKFVAVACGSPSKPVVVNATDTDWWEFHAALKKHGVTIEFICPELMKTRDRPAKARKRRR